MKIGTVLVYSRTVQKCARNHAFLRWNLSNKFIKWGREACTSFCPMVLSPNMPTEDQPCVTIPKQIFQQLFERNKDPPRTCLNTRFCYLSIKRLPDNSPVPLARFIPKAAKKVLLFRRDFMRFIRGWDHHQA